jgi:hypothetical protein
MRSLLVAAILCALTAPFAYADTTPVLSGVARLEAAGGTASWSYVPSGRRERFGHAESLVSAPTQLVRDQATDFAHYKDLSHGRIHNSRLVDRRPGVTDVYLQVPVLHGMVTLWQVLRFSDVQRAADGTESFTGTLVRGNVRAAEMTVRIRPAGANRSIVECDLLVVPEFMAPQSVVDAELRDAAVNVVHAFGGQAEQKYAQLTAPPPPAAVAMAGDAGAP